MDLGVGILAKLNSIHHDEEHPLHSPNSGRKRKLQLEQQVLAVSKHKFLHRRSNSRGSDGGSPTSHHLVPDESFEDSIDETETSPELHEGPEQMQGSSCKASSSLLEGSDNTMELDHEGHVEMSPKMFVPSFEPPASTPSSPEGVAFKDSLYSLDSRIVKNKDLDCQLTVPGVDEGVDECIEEECPNGPIEELMLSCDDVGLNTLGLFSARWSSKQDALPGAEKPTIDKEFEQYFSMFML